MDPKEVIEQIQQFLAKEFTKTRFGSSDACYQDEQLEKVRKLLSALQAQYPDLRAMLNGDQILIPSIEEAGSLPHMENIGKSATECLEVLDSEAGEDEDPLTQNIRTFLREVATQAQNACANALQAPKSQDEYSASLVESVTDFNKRVNEIILDAEKQLQIHAKKAAESAVQQAATDAAKKVESSTQDAATAAKDAATAAEKAAKEAEDARQAANSILPNMLTTLGIFVAIIVAVVACYLSILLAKNGYTNTGPYSRPLEFLQFLIMGHIMLGIIFLLLFLVSKLTTYSLASYCHRFDPKESGEKNNMCDCSKCKYKCTLPKRLRRRYPYVFGINLAFFLGYVALGLWQVINLYFRECIDKWILQNQGWAALIIAGLLFGLFLLIFCIFWCRDKKNEP